MSSVPNNVVEGAKAIMSTPAQHAIDRIIAEFSIDELPMLSSVLHCGGPSESLVRREGLESVDAGPVGLNVVYACAAIDKRLASR